MTFLLASLSLALAATPQATTRPANQTLPIGLFSNMMQSPGDGDVEGVELKISFEKGQYWAAYSYGEGGCDAIVKAPLKRDNDRWLFEKSKVADIAAEPTDVRFWLKSTGKAVRIFASKQTDWIAHSPVGDLLRPIRHAICIHSR